MHFLKPYTWRLIGTGIGLATAISFLTLGFFRTLVILICCGIGLGLGTMTDRSIPFPKELIAWRKKWR